MDLQRTGISFFGVLATLGFLKQKIGLTRCADEHLESSWIFSIQLR